MFLWLQSQCFSSVGTSKNFPFYKTVVSYLPDPSLSRTGYSHFASLVKPCTETISQSDCRKKAFKYTVDIIRNNIQRRHHKKNRNVRRDVKLSPWRLIQSLFFHRSDRPWHDGRNLILFLPTLCALASLSSLLHGSCQRQATVLHLRSSPSWIFSHGIWFCISGAIQCTHKHT